MSRILKAYRTRFHQLLQEVNARRVEQGVDWLVAKANRISAEGRVSLAAGLTRVYEELAARPEYCSPASKLARSPEDISFFCDAGLGGLARWLRAAGYSAAWESGIDDNVLLEHARQGGETILTTDSMMMERRLLRDRVIPALWLPPSLKIDQQLEKVFREFNLGVGTPRCMSCGGKLKKADKESLRDRIPPKTYRWLNDFFLCAQCGKLFWQGTHWQRIVSRLHTL